MLHSLGIHLHAVGIRMHGMGTDETGVFDIIRLCRKLNAVQIGTDKNICFVPFKFVRNRRKADIDAFALTLFDDFLDSVVEINNPAAHQSCNFRVEYDPVFCHQHRISGNNDFRLSARLVCDCFIGLLQLIAHTG